MSSAAGLLILLPVWLATFSAFWLVWWAAQTRDAAAFKVVALMLAVVPALLMPILTVILPQYLRDSYTQVGMIFGMVSAAVAVARALFLIVWAAVSKDAAVLRAGGAVIAGLVLVFYLLELLAVMSLGNFRS